MAKRIAFVVGSTRRGSFNLQLATIAEGMLEGRADVVYIDPAPLPFVNQDIESPAPELVKNARDIVMSSDALWIFTPEYNQSIPGILKNLLDWLSRPLDPSDPDRKTAIKGKKSHHIRGGRRQKNTVLPQGVVRPPFIHRSGSARRRRQRLRSGPPRIHREYLGTG